MEKNNKENASPTILKSFAEEFEEGMKKGEMEGILKGKVEGKREGKIEGKLEGKLEERHAIAQKLIIKQFSMEEISGITGLSLDELAEIQKTIN